MLTFSESLKWFDIQHIHTRRLPSRSKWNVGVTEYIIHSVLEECNHLTVERAKFRKKEI